MVRILIPELRKEFEALIDKLKTSGLNQQDLRDRYKSVLREVSRLEREEGKKILDAKLRTAFQQRVRFSAKRIVQTEIHKEYSKARAQELRQQADVLFLRWMLADDHPMEDICDYLAGVDAYGIGPGIYPKLKCPSPGAHPFCRCYLEPAENQTGRKPRKQTKAAERWFKSAFSEDDNAAARVAGSRDKLSRVLGGEDPVEILNERRDFRYWLISVGDT